MSDFDIDEFRIVQAPIRSMQNRIGRTEPGKRFVPGPVPIALLLRFRVPVALRVWLALHTRQRMRYTPRISKEFMLMFGLSKRDAQRGVAELERRGLVRVDRQPGRAAIIELLPLSNRRDSTDDSL